jgi:flagellar assembly factor FliW
MMGANVTLLTLADGLVGLPDATRFTVHVEEASPIVELLSADPSGLGFLATSLADIRPGVRDRMVELGHAAPDEIVLVLLGVHGDPPAVTANLAGPIVIHPLDGSGRQLVLEGDEFPLRAWLTTLD